MRPPYVQQYRAGAKFSSQNLVADSRRENGLNCGASVCGRVPSVKQPPQLQEACKHPWLRTDSHPYHLAGPFDLPVARDLLPADRATDQ